MLCWVVSCPVMLCDVMSCHVLTRKLFHVSGRVLSCRFVGVIFHVSRLVTSSCVMACLFIQPCVMQLCAVPLFLQCYFLLLVSSRVMSCRVMERLAVFRPYM